MCLADNRIQLHLWPKSQFVQVFRGQGDGQRVDEVNDVIQENDPADNPGNDEFWMNNGNMNLVDVIQRKLPEIETAEEEEEDESLIINEDREAEAADGQSVPIPREFSSYRDQATIASSVDSSVPDEEMDNTADHHQPSTSRQRRPRRSSEVLDDFNVLTIDDNASTGDDSVFLEPDQTVRLAKKVKRSGSYKSPNSIQSSTPSQISGFVNPRRSNRLSSVSSVSSDDLDFHLELDDTMEKDLSPVSTSTPKR